MKLILLIMVSLTVNCNSYNKKKISVIKEKIIGTWQLEEETKKLEFRSNNKMITHWNENKDTTKYNIECSDSKDEYSKLVEYLDTINVIKNTILKVNDTALTLMNFKGKEEHYKRIATTLKKK